MVAARRAELQCPLLSAMGVDPPLFVLVLEGFAAAKPGRSHGIELAIRHIVACLESLADCVLAATIRPIASC
jgi:hypothetical protein